MDLRLLIVQVKRQGLTSGAESFLRPLSLLASSLSIVGELLHLPSRLCLAPADLIRLAFERRSGGTIARPESLLRRSLRR